MRFPPTVEFYLDRESQKAFGGAQGKEQLHRFRDLLNSTKESELRDRLRKLIKEWIDSGPNLLKMMGTNSGLKDLFTMQWLPEFRGGRAVLIAIPNLTQLERLCKGNAQQSVGESVTHDGTPREVMASTPEAMSWIAFGLFTLNHYCEDLRGPCPRCLKYFVKKKNKVYCTRQCGNAFNAVVYTALKRKAEHDEKMIRAEALIQKWNTLKKRPGLVWKVWLKEHAPSITEKFVTRRVNMGELKEPKPGSKP